jgi:hypothetical protein
MSADFKSGGLYGGMSVNDPRGSSRHGQSAGRHREIIEQNLGAVFHRNPPEE